MATTVTETDLAALQLTPDRSTAPLASRAQGKLKRMQAIYTFESGNLPVSADIIKVCLPPPGAIVIGSSCFATIDIAGADDFQLELRRGTTAFAHINNITTDGVYTFAEDTVATELVPAIDNPFDGSTWLNCEFSTVTTAVANTKIIFDILFSTV